MSNHIQKPIVLYFSLLKAFNLPQMVWKHLIVVTFISASHFLYLSHFFFKVTSDSHDLLFEIFCQVFDFFFKLLNNSLFIKIIVNLNLSNLCFNDCNSLFNLIIRYLCNHNLHFIFNFIYKLTFVLSIHRSTLTTSQHASYVCSVFGTAALEHRKHLFKLKFNIDVYGVIYWCFRTCHAGRTVFSLVGNSAIISRKQRIFICLRQRSQSLPLASRNI